MQLVLDHIIAHEEKFDMSTFGNVDKVAGHICCTAACICGTTNLIAKTDAVEKIYNTTSEYNGNDSYYTVLYNLLRDNKSAAEFLGLETKYAECLFFGGEESVWHKYREELHIEEYPDLDSIETKHAITMLTNLISGEWNFEGILPSEEDEDEQ